MMGVTDRYLFPWILEATRADSTELALRQVAWPYRDAPGDYSESGHSRFCLRSESCRNRRSLAAHRVISACAAASRAIGTRYGEQLT